MTCHSVMNYNLNCNFRSLRSGRNAPRAARRSPAHRNVRSASNVERRTSNVGCKKRRSYFPKITEMLLTLLWLSLMHSIRRSSEYSSLYLPRNPPTWNMKYSRTPQAEYTRDRNKIFRFRRYSTRDICPVYATR